MSFLLIVQAQKFYLDRQTDTHAHNTLQLSPKILVMLAIIYYDLSPRFSIYTLKTQEIWVTDEEKNPNWHT